MSEIPISARELAIAKLEIIREMSDPQQVKEAIQEIEDLRNGGFSCDAVTRIELISDEGRVVTTTARAVQVVLRDDGHTLKIFYEG